MTAAAAAEAVAPAAPAAAAPAWRWWTRCSTAPCGRSTAQWPAGSGGQRCTRSSSAAAAARLQPPNTWPGQRSSPTPAPGLGCTDSQGLRADAGASCYSCYYCAGNACSSSHSIASCCGATPAGHSTWQPQPAARPSGTRYSGQPSGGSAGRRGETCCQQQRYTQAGITLYTHLVHSGGHHLVHSPCTLRRASPCTLTLYTQAGITLYTQAGITLYTPCYAQLPPHLMPQQPLIHGTGRCCCLAPAGLTGAGRQQAGQATAAPTAALLL